MSIDNRLSGSPDMLVYLFLQVIVILPPHRDDEHEGQSCEYYGLRCPGAGLQHGKCADHGLAKQDQCKEREAFQKVMSVCRCLQQHGSAGQRQEYVQDNPGVEHGITQPGVKEQGTGRDRQPDPEAGPEVTGRSAQMPLFLGMRVMILHRRHRPESEIADQKRVIGGVKIDRQAGGHNQHEEQLDN
ncbi:hypothetical protein D3C73_1221590 [compost metagenome]